MWYSISIPILPDPKETAMKKLFRSSLAWLLAAVTVLSGCHKSGHMELASSQPVSTSSLVEIAEPILTRQQAAQRLAQAAAQYSTITPEALLASLELQGTASEPSGTVTRAEMLVMLSNAFGKIPEPNLSTMYTHPLELEFTDIPSWAEPSLENLTQAGLLTGEETGDDLALLHPEETVSSQELETMIRRVYAHIAQREQDDFWATSTQRWRSFHSLFPGYGIETPSVIVSRNTISQVAADVVSLAEQTSHTPGSDEERIANFYNCVMDETSRNAAGNQPILPYITAFSQAQSLDQLLEALYQCYRDTGISLLYDFTPTVDNRDSNHYIFSFTYAGISLNKDSLTEPYNQTLIDGFLDYLTYLFRFAGFSDEEAKLRAQTILDYNLQLAPLEWAPEEEYNVDNTYNLYTMEQLQELFPSIELDVMRQVQGYGAEDTQKILISNPVTLEFFSSKCTEENLELLKSLAIANLVGGFSAFLTTDLNQTAHDFKNLYTGTTGTPTLEEYAYYYTRSILDIEANRYYAQTYCSAEDKETATGMIREMIEIFRKRIDNLTWMSEETKENAKRKLDTMRIQVGYPEQWDDSYAGISILPPKEGENRLMENIFSFYRRGAQLMPQLLHEEVDKETWGSDLMTVNAYYSPICNSITVPAGSLQAPFFDSDAALEENLAGIGFFIAHEITHSFDDNGAKYDQDGNAAGWWTQEDYQAFQQLCQKVVTYYDGYETAPGIVNNGQRSLSENIADLGAMACVLDYLAEQPNGDYQAFFHAFAGCWASNASRSYLQYLATDDVHSFDNVRVNRTLSAFQKFYDTFGIVPGDGMYVPQEERPMIW